MRPRLLAALTLALSATLVLPASATAAGSAHAPHSTQSTRRAERALARAEALFAPHAPGARTAGPAHGRDATMLLRDLRLRMGALSPADRRTAHQILARPTNGVANGAGHAYTTAEATPVCNVTPSFCVHYVSSTADAATPDQVTTTVNTLQTVWSTEVDTMGYQAPLDDTTSGNSASDPDSNPNGGLDIYLEDLGNDDLYGYCTSDDPSAARQVSAYCVLDNDYATSQYGTQDTPLEDLEVTLAHEFFHAVQFSYDSYEDTFFMEGTAAWMEDEVYPNINNNLQYLSQSPLKYPSVPLDYYYYGSTPSQTYLPYGSWIWWKFLTEWTKPGKAVDATLIRDVWTKAKGSPYSLQALKRALTARHQNLTRAFTVFEVWNRNPRTFYRDGRLYPAAPLGLKRTLTNTHRGTGRYQATLGHLEGGTARYTPGTGLGGNWRLRIQLNMPDRDRGSAAAVTVHWRSGSQSTRYVALNRSGSATPTVAFSRGQVNYVELSLVNASTRYACGRDYVYACNGKPLDGGLNDGLPTVFSATAIR